MTKLIDLKFKVLPSKSWGTVIELTVEFEITHEQYKKRFEEFVMQGLLYKVSESVYRYSDKVQHCNTVLGVIADLQELQDGIEPKCDHVIEAQYQKLMQTLFNF